MIDNKSRFQVNAILPGVLVMTLGTQIPDRAIGIIVAAVVVGGGVKILGVAKSHLDVSSQSDVLRECGKR